MLCASVGLMVSTTGLPSPRVNQAATVAVGSRTQNVRDPRPQSNAKRLWAGEIKTLLFTIGTDRKMLLFRPLQVLTDSMENIYILDFDDRSVKKFSKDGTYLRTFGYGKGKGPGELSNPTDFDIAPDGSVWVCDPINGFITVFSSHGAVEKTVRLSKETPLRVACRDDGSFFVLPAQSGRHLFSAYDKQGKLVGRFGELFENQSQIQIALDGRWASGSSNYSVFVFYRVGLFVVYMRQSLSPAVYAQTLNYRGFPSIVRFERGDSRITRVDRNAPYASLAASIVGEELYILVGDDGEAHKSVIDTYDLNSGMYRRSFILSSDVSFAHITREKVYTIQDTTVSVWSR